MHLNLIAQALVLLWGYYLGLAQTQSDEHTQTSTLNASTSPVVQPNNTSDFSNGTNRVSEESSRQENEDDDEEIVWMGEEEDTIPSSTPASSVGVSPSSATETDELRYLQQMRERARQLRLRNFQQNILSSLGLPSPPVVNSVVLESALNQLQSLYNSPIPTAVIPEDRSCYLASCSVPKSTNSTLWYSESQPGLRLHFNLPKLAREGTEEVRTAKLKIFIKPRTEEHSCNAEVSEAFSELFVTVYQFIRPLSIRKRNRVVNRRRLLDVKMIPGHGNVWISFNIKRAVTTWVTRSRRNFGLEVVIKDVNETVVNVGDFIVPSACTTDNGRTCRDDSGEAVELVPWPPSQIRDLVIMQNTPYVDVVIVDRVPLHQQRRSRQQNLHGRLQNVQNLDSRQ